MNALIVHNPYPCGEASLSLLLQRKEAKKRARKCQLQGVLVARGLPELGLNTLQFAPFPDCRPRGKCESIVLSVLAFSFFNSKLYGGPKGYCNKNFEKSQNETKCSSPISLTQNKPRARAPRKMSEPGVFAAIARAGQCEKQKAPGWIFRLPFWLHLFGRAKR
jgi:hypothetical protein